jgi:hypothetical protein
MAYVFKGIPSIFSNIFPTKEEINTQKHFPCGSERIADGNIEDEIVASPRGAGQVDFV